jgi:iron(III) transport system substrate-binding protein
MKGAAMKGKWCRNLFLAASCLCLAGGAALSAGPPSNPGTSASVIAAAEKEGKLIVYSTTDAVVVDSFLKDFRDLYPKITLEYNDLNSTELYNRIIGEAVAGEGSGDILWSSAMDLQIKLANDGYAMEYNSPEAAKLPSWAIWRNEAFGTTFEPIVFVYNKRLLKAGEIPRTHAELVKLLKANPPRFRGKLASYDPERSGVGFNFITQDAAIDPNFWDTAKTFGNAGIKLYTSTGAMMERIQSGEHLIGYNMIGSYVLSRMKKDPSLGIVYPKDYTLVMSRIAIIPKAAKHPNAAKVFLDYLLSGRGQDLLANKALLFAIRPGVIGEATQTNLEKTLGKSLRQIHVGPGLLTYLDQSKRLDFLRKWQQATTGK